MSSYLPSAELTALLPTGHGFSAGSLADFIARGSAMVDSELAHIYFVPFTDYSASPAATPPYPVRVAASWFAAYFAYSALSMTEDVQDASEPQACWDRARKVLEPYRDEKPNQALQLLAPETITEQFWASSAWGDGDPYTSNQIALSVARGEVIPDSVRVLTSASAVTDYVLDEDFYVRYHPGTRKWIFNRVDGDSRICSQTTLLTDGDKVQYEVVRVKRREIISPKLHSIELRRG